MKRMRGTLLLITLLVLLVGVVSAAEVSGDTAGSITEKAVIQDTPTVSDTVGTVQDDKVSDNKLDDEITKATDKTAKDNNLKSDATVTSWQELRSAVNALGNKTGKEARSHWEKVPTKPVVQSDGAIPTQYLQLTVTDRQ